MPENSPFESARSLICNILSDTRSLVLELFIIPEKKVLTLQQSVLIFCTFIYS